MVASLLEHETVDTDEVLAILGDTPYPRKPDEVSLPKAASVAHEPESVRAEKPKRFGPNISPEPA
jgi:hypothetical protein